jgi:hypothetical protein
MVSCKQYETKYQIGFCAYCGPKVRLFRSFRAQQYQGDGVQPRNVGCSTLTLLIPHRFALRNLFYGVMDFCSLWLQKSITP